MKFAKYLQKCPQFWSANTKTADSDKLQITVSDIDFIYKRLFCQNHFRKLPVIVKVIKQINNPCRPNLYNRKASNDDVITKICRQSEELY